MNLVKYKLWVSEIDDDKKIIYAEGYKENQKNDTRHGFEINFDWLKEKLNEKDYQELSSNPGRIFEYHLDEENECNDKIIVPYYPPLTQEEIKEIERRAKEMSENLRWDDGESDSRND